MMRSECCVEYGLNVICSGGWLGIYWYTWIFVWRMDAMAAITKSWAKMSRLGKRDGFNVGRMECSITVVC